MESDGGLDYSKPLKPDDRISIETHCAICNAYLGLVNAPVSMFTQPLHCEACKRAQWLVKQIIDGLRDMFVQFGISTSPHRPDSPPRPDRQRLAPPHPR